MEGVLAVIWMFGGNFAPRGWALCQGQLLAIAQNQALFSLLGTTYGGDGRTTFGLPDLRGRAPMGEGSGPGLSTRRIGQMGGAENMVLNTNQIPSHSHATAVNVSNAPGEESTVNGQVIANHASAFNENSVSGQTLGGVTSAVTGGGQAHSNVQPYTVVNYVICMNGLFPSRN
jgi:microcystin-dependent protein